MKFNTRTKKYRVLFEQEIMKLANFFIIFVLFKTISTLEDYYYDAYEVAPEYEIHVPVDDVEITHSNNVSGTDVNVAEVQNGKPVFKLVFEFPKKYICYQETMIGGQMDSLSKVNKGCNMCKVCLEKKTKEKSVDKF